MINQAEALIGHPVEKLDWNYSCGKAMHMAGLPAPLFGQDASLWVQNNMSIVMAALRVSLRYKND